MDSDLRISDLVKAVMAESIVEHNGVKSLTKDVVFFATFIFQVIILFVSFGKSARM
jgi:hypothetical protein